jgi:GGDEF domain-containing protein
MEPSRHNRTPDWPALADVTAYVDGHRDLFDPVTGLPGPVLLVDRVEMALARARRLRCFVGVFALRDDYVEGNTPPSLTQLVARLRSELRNDDTLARIDGRAFVVVCGDLYRPEDADRIGDRLLRHLGVTGAVGVALVEPTDTVTDVLLRAARAVRPRKLPGRPYPEPMTRRFTR